MNYHEFPDNARVWVYQSDREFTADEADSIKSKGANFIKTWDSHGAGLRAAIEIFYNRFIVIFVDENQAAVSGCAIDKSVHFIKQVEKDFGVSLFDRIKIAYWNGNKVHTIPMFQLQKNFAAAFGEKAEEVIVFNNLVKSKKEFMTHWQIPLKQSWILAPVPNSLLYL